MTLTPRTGRTLNGTAGGVDFSSMETPPYRKQASTSVSSASGQTQGSGLRLQPQNVSHQRMVTRSASQKAVQGPHESADPTSAARIATCACEHDAPVANSPRQILFVEYEVVRGILGHNHSTLSCRPDQNLSVVPMSQLRQGSRRYHIVSTLPELVRNRDREMLVEEQSQPLATRRRRRAAASASSARS
jgi:hypothetical protein